MAAWLPLDLPRSRPRRKFVMHVHDAGNAEEGAIIAQFRCKRCGHETDWLVCETLTEARKGIPCPLCNKGIKP